MAKPISHKAPTPEIVARAFTPLGTGGASAVTGLVGHVEVIMPITASSTLTGWINPEGKTIYANPKVVWTTAGTGTYDCGLSTGGTGAAATFIDGGTMAVGIVERNAASSTLGAAVYSAVGGSGSATDSITVVHNEATTSTAVGFLIIDYYVVN